MELRHPHHHLGTGANPGLHDQSKVVTERGPQSFVHIGQTDVPVGLSCAVGGCGIVDEHSGVHAHSVVLHRDRAFGAGVMGDDGDRAEPRLAGQAVADGVLHQRLQAQERQSYR